MSGVATGIRVATRAAGGVQVALGVAMWIGYPLAPVKLHVALGIGIVALLWGTALFAARRGAGPLRVAIAIGWGLLVVALGLRQDAILPGGLHWTVQVLHLAVGLAALAQIELLVRAITPRPASSVARAPA